MVIYVHRRNRERHGSNEALSFVCFGLAQESLSSAHRREAPLWTSLLVYQLLESVERREEELDLRNVVTELSASAMRLDEA